MILLDDKNKKSDLVVIKKLYKFSNLNIRIFLCYIGEKEKVIKKRRIEENMIITLF